MRVLIVKRDKLGDLLLTTPLLARLAAARPDAEVHLLANDYNAWVARDHPAVHRTWTYPRVRDGGRLRLQAALAHLPIAWRLRRQRFDVAVVMGGDESPRGIRRAIGTGAARVVAYAHDAHAVRPAPHRPAPRARRRPRDRADARAARAARRAAAPGRRRARRSRCPPRGARSRCDGSPSAASRPAATWSLGLGARRAKKQPDTAR